MHPPLRSWRAVALLVVGIIGVIVSGCGQRFTVIKARPAAASGGATRDEAARDSVAPANDKLLQDGLMLYREADYEAAASTFRELIAQQPDSWQGYYGLGLVKTRLEAYEEARQDLYLSLDLAPADPRTRSMIYRSIAENFEAQGKLGQAELHYRTALNLFPESTLAQRGLDRTRMPSPSERQ